MAIIYAGTNGYLDSVDVEHVRAFETELYQFIETRHARSCSASLAEKKQLDDQIKAELDAAVKEFGDDVRGRKEAAA